MIIIPHQLYGEYYNQCRHMRTKVIGMSLFDKKEVVFGPQEVLVGELDYSVEGGYRNVVTIPLEVKPKRMLRVRIRSDAHVDVVVANENRSAAGHKEAVREAEFGPYDTGKSKSMGLILGVFRGDRARVIVEAWVDKE